MDSKTLKSIRNFILLILIAWFVKTTILEIYVVPTGSMFDTIEENDLVIGNKFIYGLRTPNWIGIPFSRTGSYIPNYRFPEFKKVQNGDITVFEFPYDDMHKYVKRTIGLPKQYIEIKEGKISVGDSEESIIYKEKLTYPEKSRIKKEIDSLLDDPRPTEKGFRTFQHNKYSELFSYYQPIDIEAPNNKYDKGEDFLDVGNGKYDEGEKFVDSRNGKWSPSEIISDTNGNGKWDEGEKFVDKGNSKWDEGEKFIDGKKYIDRDNMKFQVPFKGMNIDLNDETTDLYSALMILLLDGYDISLRGDSVDDLGAIYSLDTSKIDYDKLESSKTYQFHKFDNEQMFDTSMTIWGFVSSMPIFIVLLIIGLISWKLYSLGKDMFKSSNNRFKIGNVSQLILYCSFLFFIIYLATVDVEEMRNNRSRKLVDAVNNDLLDSRLSLKDFFKYKLENERDIFSNNSDDSLNLEYESYRDSYNSSINQLIINHYLALGVGNVPNPAIDCESIYDININKTVDSRSVEKYRLLYAIFDGEKTPKSLRNEVSEVMVNYYNYKNIYDYNVNSKINKKLKEELSGYILVDGVSLLEKANYVLQHNYYFMVGDNRNGSSDSRSWGFVPDYNLLGQPVITLANFGKFKLKFDVHL